MRYPGRILGWAFVIALAALGSARPQDTQTKKPTQSEATSQKPTPDSKSVLLEASRASTAKAAEGAAKEKVKEPTAEEKPAEVADDSPVTELRPIPPSKQGEESKESGEKDQKKSKSGPLKGIHGSAYGGSGSGANAAGASAGASTKSGKSSIYVQGQGVRPQ